jgi:ABC-type branched-subunit amino acid transport system substrate-binding protein
MTADDDAWRIGVLFSHSGVMETNDTENFLGTMLGIEEVNRKGGVLGRRLAPVCYDPRSRPSEYRRLANKLMVEDGVDIIFGCSTSMTRKVTLPVIERRNGLLWYPTHYEGFEYSPNVIYTGEAPNQFIIQLASFVQRNIGRRCVLIGSDYVFPRQANRILKEVVDQEGGEILGEIYVPMAPNDAALHGAVAEIRRLAPDAVFATVVGANAPTFYRLYREAGLDAARCPIASLTMAEMEVRVAGIDNCEGHLSCSSYFAGAAGGSPDDFRTKFRARFGEHMEPSRYSAIAYAQIHLFAAALARAGSLEPERLSAAVYGVEVDAPYGSFTIDPDTNHAWLPARIGQVNRQGLFDVVWQSAAMLKPDPFFTNPIMYRA